MQKRLLLDSKLLKITIQRLCEQLIENHDDFSNSAILGLQPRGVFFAQRIKARLDKILKTDVALGFLDITFHRDDFRRRDQPISPSETRVPFMIEKKKVVLIDDVLFTGRSVRAALDAIISFGRPDKVELLVLIDRLYSRHIPVEANYIGKKVNTLTHEKVNVELVEQGGEDNIWLVHKNDE